MPRKPKLSGKDLIYGLADPRNGHIRYVGKTNNPTLRLERHLRDRRASARVRWLKELKAEGLVPLMVILEVIHPPDTWQDREIWWISFGREHAWDLTNVADGGDGPPPAYRNTPPAQRRRMRSIHI